MRNLSPSELEKFGDFIHSPFFNKSEKIIKLYERLIKDYPDLHFKNDTDESLHNELFPNLKYNCATFRHLFSDLYYHVERFLVEINFKSRKFEKIGYLIDEMQTRNHFEFIETLLNKQENMLDNNKVLGSIYYLNKFKSETDKFNFKNSLPSSFSKEKIDNTLKTLNNRNKYLVMFFFVEILKSIDTIQVVSRKYNSSYYGKFTEDLVDNIDINKMIRFLRSHPELADYSITLSIYYKLFITFRNMDCDKYYFDLKQEIKSNLYRYSNEEKSYLYKKLIDYCIIKNKLNKDSSVSDNELFSVYNDILEMSLYRNDETNYFPADLFRNIIILSLRLKKYEWTENFIQSYFNELPEKSKANIFNLSCAYLYFERSEFEKSLYYLNKLKLNNTSIKLDTKNLLLRLYYEMDYYESLSSLNSAYKGFLSCNTNISKSRKKSHLEFVKFTESLMLLKLSRNEEMLQILKNKIETTNNLVNKNWLLCKVDLILKSIHSN